jgi:hypothetical protein
VNHASSQASGRQAGHERDRVCIRGSVDLDGRIGGYAALGSQSKTGWQGVWEKYRDAIGY